MRRDYYAEDLRESAKIRRKCVYATFKYSPKTLFKRIGLSCTRCSVYLRTRRQSNTCQSLRSTVVRRSVNRYQLLQCEMGNQGTRYLHRHQDPRSDDHHGGWFLLALHGPHGELYISDGGYQRRARLHRTGDLLRIVFLLRLELPQFCDGRTQRALQVIANSCEFFPHWFVIRKKKNVNRDQISYLLISIEINAFCAINL